MQSGPVVSRPRAVFHPWEDKAPLRALELLAAARIREGRGVDTQRAQVACLRAAVTFDSGGGSASSAENCECTTDETLVISCGSHLLARFRFLSDEQKMGFGRSFCNAQSDTPAMQWKQALELGTVGIRPSALLVRACELAGRCGPICWSPKNNTARRSFDPEPFFILGRIRRP